MYPGESDLYPGESYLYPEESDCHAKKSRFDINIARGTTDPEFDSVTWIELGNNMAPLTLVANLTT